VTGIKFRVYESRELSLLLTLRIRFLVYTISSTLGYHHTVSMQDNRNTQVPVHKWSMTSKQAYNTVHTGFASPFWLRLAVLASPSRFGFASPFWLRLAVLASPRRFGFASPFWLRLAVLASPRRFGFASPFWLRLAVLASPRRFGFASPFWLRLAVLASMSASSIESR